MVYSSEKVIPTKREVEEKLKSMGDYVKMDYLSRCLKNNLDFETRKFVLNNLSKIYESRGMYSEAGRLSKSSADINTTFDGKINDFMKSVELFIKAGNFDEAENTFNKSVVLGNSNQKVDMKMKKKLFYFNQAKEYTKRDKRKHAMETYQHILTLELTDTERTNIQNALMELYQKLGKIKEYYNLKKSGESKIITPELNKTRKSFLPEEKKEESGRKSLTWDVESLF